MSKDFKDLKDWGAFYLFLSFLMQDIVKKVYICKRNNQER